MQGRIPTLLALMLVAPRSAVAPSAGGYLCSSQGYSSGIPAMRSPSRRRSCWRKYVWLVDCRGTDQLSKRRLIVISGCNQRHSANAALASSAQPERA